jgi:hypothetical protein
MIFKDFAAVPSVATDLPRDDQGNWPIALRFGVACDAVLMALDKSTATFKAIAAGETIPGTTRQVVSVSAGVATDVVAYFEYPKA